MYKLNYKTLLKYIETKMHVNHEFIYRDLNARLRHDFMYAWITLSNVIIIIIIIIIIILL